MALKKIDPKQLELLKSELLAGKKVADLVSQFSLSASSINNYKARWKKTGELIKKSSLVKETLKPKLNKAKKSAITEKIEPDTKAARGFNFLVNGTQILIDSSAKRVSIGKNQIEVDF